MPSSTIAMGIRQPAQAQAPALINPLAAGLDIMRMQQLQNENTKFQLQMQANQAVGSIMARHEGDEDGGLRELMSSQWAPMVPDFINTIRASRLALQQTQESLARTGEINLKAGNTTMQAWMHSLLPLKAALDMGTTDDETLNGLRDAAVQQTLATVSSASPAQRQAAMEQINASMTSLYANLPSDQASRLRVLNQRLNSSIGALGGLSKEDYDFNYGTPYTEEQGAGTIHGFQSPAFGQRPTSFVERGIGPGVSEGGAYAGVPSPSTQLPPSPGVARTDLGVNLPRIYNMPGYGSPNALGGQAVPPPSVMPPPVPAPPSAAAPAAPTAPVAAPPAAPTPPAEIAPAAPTAAPPPPQPAVPGPQSWQPSGTVPTARSDGKPLWDNTTNWNAPGNTKGSMDITGRSWKWQDNETKAPAVAAALKEYNEGTGFKRYDSARATVNQLQVMDDDLNRMAGTPLSTGDSFEQRQFIANRWNTAMDVLHNIGGLPDDVYNKARFDQGALASAASFQKAMTNLQFSTVTQSFEGNREAAQVIMRALTAVPDTEKSYQGNKFVLEALRRTANRVLDLRDFQDQWLANPANHQDLNGSVAAFDKLHDPVLAARQLADEFGLGSKGFQSQEQINNAARKGYIRPEDAAAAASKLPKVQQ